MRLGEYQELVCVKKVDFGIYLSTSSASEKGTASGKADSGWSKAGG